MLLHARAASAGTTHTWRWRVRPDAAALARCLDDMDRIVEARRGLLADDHGRTQGAAVFRGARVVGDAGAALPEVSFNGVGDDGYEAFGFPLAPFTAADPSFQFVKTAGRPYDEVVVACLIAARDCFPPESLAISSDVAWEPDWSQGAALYERVLGRRARSPLEGATDSAPGEGARAQATARPEPPASAARKRALLGVIVVLGLAIGFVLTREAR